MAAPRQTGATKKGSPRISNHESTLMHTNEEWLVESIRVHSRLRNFSLAAPLQTGATKKGSPRISNHESTLMHTNEEWLFESIRGYATSAWLPRFKPERPRKAAPEFRTTNQH